MQILKATEYTLQEAKEYTNKRGKNTRFYFNVYGYSHYFTLRPTFATPTGNLKGYPRSIVIKPNTPVFFHTKHTTK